MSIKLYMHIDLDLNGHTHRPQQDISLGIGRNVYKFGVAVSAPGLDCMYCCCILFSVVMFHFQLCGTHLLYSHYNFHNIYYAMHIP